MTCLHLAALTLLTAAQVLAPLTALTSPIRALAPQSGDATTNSKKTSSTIQLLTDPEGVDFAPFLTSLYRAVKAKWIEGMPASVKLGEQGLVTIQFRIQQDGKVPESFLKATFSSGKKELEEASLKAIRKAAPFEHLPDKFSKPYIELRVSFYYNFPQKSQ
jgi:TonB family protein